MIGVPAMAHLPEQLAQRIDRVMREVRARLGASEPDRDVLFAIRDLLQQVAAEGALFSIASFPLDPRSRDAVYMLSEDPGQRLALYLGMRDAALSTPVHNHKTWASIVGVHGCERNRFFERTVSGALKEVGSVDVVPGSGVAMAQDDLHSIATDAGVLNMQLHLYGRSFEAQEGRVMVDPATGEERRFAGHPEVQIPRGRITAAMLHRMIQDGRELAVLDLRPAQAHCEAGHPLVATSLPLDRLADELVHRIPNRQTRIVLFDDDDRVAQAKAILARAGYAQPFHLSGGPAAWTAAGYLVFEGINVPAKAFGEHLEQASHTPVITPNQLAAWQAERRPMLLVDCRTQAEHRRMTIAGSVNLPGAESLTRVRGLAPDSSTPIVVHCAGRTRGLVAAQTLIDAGCPNPVLALENGLIGWLLAGQTMEVGGGRPVPAAIGEPLAGPQSSVPHIDAATLEHWLNDSSRTTYVLDVRSADEYGAAHHPRAQLAPAGELLQQFDAFIPVRHSRVVLTGDDARTRAVAALLLRADWCEPALLVGAFKTVPGSAPERPALPRGWRPPFDEHEQDPVRMRGYIQWELGLLNRISSDGSINFR